MLPTYTTPRTPRLFLGGVLCVLMSVWGIATHAQESITRGTVKLLDDTGSEREVPLLFTEVDIDVTGQIARTVVSQHFKNPTNEWSEGIYLFPLPPDAAVDQMRMKIGDRLVEGKVKEKQEAKAVYQKARAEGKRAALVEQDRPNLFTTSVANIPPKGEITVRIEYQQSLAWRDGRFGLHFPMAVTPRYSPLQPPTQELNETVDLADGWLILPGERPHQLKADTGFNEQLARVQVNLKPGFEIEHIESTSHKLIQTEGAEGYRLELASPSVPADRDFLLEWYPLMDNTPQASFFSEQTERGSFGLLSLMPPSIIDWALPEREVTFVIDTSGSMAGESIVAARKALLAGLAGLKPGDTFNIIRFDHEAEALFAHPFRVDDSVLHYAKRFVRNLDADGGTEMALALDLALGLPSNTSRLRQVIFITDGSVSNERELFEKLDRELDGRRLFTVGIGSAPNRFFMEEAARSGRGAFTYIAEPVNAEQVMTDLFQKIERPVLTDIEISGSGIADLSPSKVPDLYYGEPLVVAMKLENETPAITIKGRIGDTAWSKTVNVRPVGNTAGIRVDWARKKIADWERAGLYGASHDQIREAVIDLALTHHLVSTFTSLVAVDVTPVRASDEALRKKLITPMKPAGLSVSMAQTALGFEKTLLFAIMLFLLGWAVLRASEQEAAHA